MGLEEPGCSDLSVSLSSIGLHFTRLSICVPITAPGGGAGCMEVGAKTQSSWSQLEFPIPWGDMGPLLVCTRPPLGQKGLERGGVGWDGRLN